MQGRGTYVAQTGNGVGIMLYLCVLLFKKSIL
ncbi:MAG: hypothetical protein KatS3mg032_2273 [Cyclobacteriaceae bacterium]|nr:MAG: hypothetical protein KatS3mg032_2273 [Cyclobacteriaceae bacterium]